MSAPESAAVTPGQADEVPELFARWYSSGWPVTDEVAADAWQYALPAEREFWRDLAGQPQPAPGDEELSSPAELARWVDVHHGDHPQWVDELRALLPVSEPAPGAISTSFTWDYRQPAPMDEIAVRVRELSGGTVTMSMPETGSDEYELVITAHPHACEPLTVKPADDVKPAPELAALRELIEEIGVMAANAPEDGDCFAVCEEIAMRVAAHGVPS